MRYFIIYDKVSGLVLRRVSAPMLDSGMFDPSIEAVYTGQSDSATHIINNLPEIR